MACEERVDLGKSFLATSEALHCDVKISMDSADATNIFQDWLLHGEILDSLFSSIQHVEP